MKASEIRSMTPEQLNEKLVGLKKDLVLSCVCSTPPISWTIP